MIIDFGIKKRLSQSFELRKRAFFVDPYQAARARDIRRQNSHQSPLYVLAAQGAPPELGEIECSYTTIVGRCPAMPRSEMGPTRKSDDAITTSALHSWTQCQRTNPLPREGLAARSGDYVCRSNSLNERR